MFKQFLYLFIALITINIIIFIHEMGHFLFAKIFGIKVEKFKLGFGKEIFGFNIKETRFSFCSILFGGYIKFLGEDLLFENIEKLKNNKDIKLSVNSEKDKIYKQKADDCDSKSNEVSKSEIDNNNLLDLNSMNLKFSEVSFLKKFFIILNGPLMNLLFSLFLIFVVNFFIGTKYYDLDKLEVRKVVKNDIDIITGDKILEFNNVLVSSWSELLNLIEKTKFDTKLINKNIPIKIERKISGRNLQKTIYVDFTEFTKNKKKLGISPILKFKKEKNFFKILKMVFIQFRFLISDFFVFRILKNFSKNFNFSEKNNEKIKITDFSGPVGILKAMKNSFSSGFYDFLMFVVILNINLCFFNLLPLIPLDGGYLILIFLQKIFSGSLEKLNSFFFFISNLTIIFLFLFTIFITIKDIFWFRK